MIHIAMWCKLTGSDGKHGETGAPGLPGFDGIPSKLKYSQDQCIS